eukprot:TRINITY_DN13644_c0_g1_i1.p1 TRINITY_DN13644_c0_g1~~TRINITY_DN13644_c0_g1_i1.p1  ORF type:complete len:418 (-),score=44.68 TRINITY_DN13644_c0_g1_i1:74-1327(-)
MNLLSLILLFITVVDNVVCSRGPPMFRFKQYPSAYQANGKMYNNLATDAGKYIRCIKESTWLSIVVLDQAGIPMSNTLLWIGTQGNVKEAYTDSMGHLKIEVTDCQLGIIVWTDGKQSEYRAVNLENNNKNVVKVVIQIGKACNYLIYFDGHRSPSGDPFNFDELVNYIVDVDGGELSTTGTTSGGEAASPLCIKVKDSGSLKVIITSQSSDIFSILCLDNVEEGGEAAMGFPRPLTFAILSRVEGGASWTFFLGANVFEDPVDGVIPICPAGSICGDGENFEVLCSDEGTITPVEGTNSVDSFAIVFGEEALDKNTCLVAIKIRVYPDQDVKGNAYIVDTRGVTNVVKMPPGIYPTYSGARHHEPYWWILGCAKHGDLKKFREVNQFTEYLPNTIDGFNSICVKGIVDGTAHGNGN